jgi:hypothetical protein
MLYCLGLEVFGTTKVHLFKNNYTPVDGSLFADFTEADFTGYAAVDLAMNLPVTVAGKASCTNNVAMQYIMGVPGVTNTVYGYYVALNADTFGYGRLLWAERFDNPVYFTNTGDELDLTPVFTLFSEF